MSKMLCAVVAVKDSGVATAITAFIFYTCCFSQSFYLPTIVIANCQQSHSEYQRY